MAHVIKIIEDNRNRAMMETNPRYAVMLNGVKVSDIYYNMRGYCGTLPLPNGGNLWMPECGISKFRKEAAAINREAKMAVGQQSEKTEAA